MSKNHKEEYDWINDPFDEKKIAQEQQQARMSSGSKVGIGCGCVVAVILIIVLCVFAATTFVGLSIG